MPERGLRQHRGPPGFPPPGHSARNVCAPGTSHAVPQSYATFVTALTLWQGKDLKIQTEYHDWGRPKGKVHVNVVLEETEFIIKKWCTECSYSWWGWWRPHPQHKTTAKSFWEHSWLAGGDSLVTGGRMKGGHAVWSFWIRRHDDLFLAHRGLTCASANTSPSPTETDK